MRVTNEQDVAITFLIEGTKPGRVHIFKQADVLVRPKMFKSIAMLTRYNSLFMN